MAVRVSFCSLTGILALLLASHDACAIVLVHDQFLETGTLAGKKPLPGPGAAWNAGAQTGVNAVTVVNTSASPVNNEVAASNRGCQRRGHCQRIRGSVDNGNNLRALTFACRPRRTRHLQRILTYLQKACFL